MFKACESLIQGKGEAEVDLKLSHLTVSVRSGFMHKVVK